MTEFVPSKRKEKVEQIKDLDCDFFNDDVDVIITKLSELREEYDKEYGSLQIGVDRDYDDYPEFTLYGVRMETDEEYDKRIAIESRRWEAREEARIKREAAKVKRDALKNELEMDRKRELYEQLKKEFEGQ